MEKIASALVKAQRAFGPALKTHTNPAFRSRYADLGACIEAVIDALNGAGIALIQKQHPNEGGVTVETIFVHESGEILSAGLLSVPAVKQDPQGYGSALTYARRYSLMAACGIAPEDDDGNAASQPQQSQARGRPAHQKQTHAAPTTADMDAMAMEIESCATLPELQAAWKKANGAYKGNADALKTLGDIKDRIKQQLEQG